MGARRRSSLAIIAALSAIGSAHGSNHPPIDPTWVARAKREGQVIYEKYEALAARLEEEAEFRFDKRPSSHTTIPFRVRNMRERTVRLGDNVINEEIRMSEGPPNSPEFRLQCDNRDYNFTLSKLSEDAPYALVDYTRGKRNQPLSASGVGLHSEVFSQFRIALSAIDNKNGWALRGLRFDAAKRLLRFDTTYGVEDGRMEYQIYLDPSHDWRFVERRTETRSAVITQIVTYGESLGGMVFPSGFSTSVVYRVANTPPNHEITARLIHLKLTDRTPDDFRLSAFGLPEPADVPPEKPTRWYLWLLIAAGACASGAVGFEYLRRRRQARNSSVALQEGNP